MHKGRKLLPKVNAAIFMLLAITMTAASSPSNAAIQKSETSIQTEEAGETSIRPISEPSLSTKEMYHAVALKQQIETTKPVERLPETVAIEYPDNKDEIDEETLNQIIADRTVTPLEERDKNRVPDYNTNVMYGEPYLTITDHSSVQWELQCACHTDEDGLRYYTDGTYRYYTVALGSAYGRTLGDTFLVTLECGKQFYIMYGDFKDDGTTDFFGPTHDDEGNLLLNYDKEPAMDLLEFIYDADHASPLLEQYGMVNALERFGSVHGTASNVVGMQYLGQVWHSKK